MHDGSFWNLGLSVSLGVGYLRVFSLWQFKELHVVAETVAILGVWLTPPSWPSSLTPCS